MKEMLEYIPELIKHWWGVLVVPIGFFLLWKYRFKKLSLESERLNLAVSVQQKDELEQATQAVRKAQKRVVDLTMELIDKDDQILEVTGENTVLYKAIVNIKINCDECSAAEIEAMPEKMKQKIPNALSNE